LTSERHIRHLLIVVELSVLIVWRWV